MLHSTLPHVMHISLSLKNYLKRRAFLMIKKILTLLSLFFLLNCIDINACKTCYETSKSLNSVNFSVMPDYEQHANEDDEGFESSDEFDDEDE